MDDNPARLSRVVLRNLFSREWHDSGDAVEPKIHGVGVNVQPAGGLLDVEVAVGECLDGAAQLA